MSQQQPQQPPKAEQHRVVFVLMRERPRMTSIVPHHPFQNPMFIWYNNRLDCIRSSAFYLLSSPTRLCCTRSCCTRAARHERVHTYIVEDTMNFGPPVGPHPLYEYVDYNRHNTRMVSFLDHENTKTIPCTSRSRYSLSTLREELLAGVDLRRQTLVEVETCNDTHQVRPGATTCDLARARLSC